MSDSDSIEEINVAPKQKVKMPRSAAQIAATQKGLEALARRRTENAIAREKAVENAKAKERGPKRSEVKPDPDYFTSDLIESVKDSVRAELAKHRSYPPEPAKEVPHKPKRRVVVVDDSSSSEEEIVVKRKKVPRVPDAPRVTPAAPKPSSFAVPEPPKLLSGSELLDSIFFRGR
ncbi:hypothetical protein I8H89_04005 [Candidatus Saccharibacteria bacterium]|nr:hypothetical protein [Candidatus Saccharibacteria bacterium]